VDIEHKTMIRVNERPFSKGALSHRVAVVHGHFRPAELRKWFDISPDAKIITWVRDPVQRVISNYYYLSDMLEKYLDEASRGLNILSKMQRSLREYAAAPVNCNRMSRFLRGVELEEMTFVGVLEHYEEDMQVLAQILGWKNYPTFHVNSGRLPKEVDPDTVKYIETHNKRDVELYQRALELRETRKAHA
jgi:hypothetical protein